MLSDKRVATAPKTAVFQMRVNPEIREEVEEICSRFGMTLTETFNILMQKILNEERIPFVIGRAVEEVNLDRISDELISQLKKTDRDKAVKLAAEKLARELNNALVVGDDISTLPTTEEIKKRYGI